MTKNMSLMKELVYTGRMFKSDEAVEVGLVSRVLPDESSLR